ncbi:hypothetical protein [Paraburkholderia sediminicola]|uniref:hypothetical protein n=1 Tax=Paraburkholderia sediminicola TaxID=458836 RepID=UPI0038B7F0FB
MKKTIDNAIDIALALVVLVFLYFHGFVDDKHATGIAARYVCIRLIFALIALCILPFRAKRYPRVVNFILFDGEGNRRTTIIFPGVCFVMLVLALLFTADLFILFLHSAVGIYKQ